MSQLLKSSLPAGKVWPGLLTLALLALVLSAQAENDLQAPTWDREVALQAAASGEDEAQLRDWFALLRNGNHTELLREITKYSIPGQQSAPVREKQLLAFTRGLADFSPSAIPSALLDLLEAYTPQTLVAREEDATSAVPLFNIRAAVQGVRHSMDRQRGESRSAQLLQSGPVAWIQAYLAAPAPGRRGFLDALGDASGQQLEVLGKAALQALRQQPALAAVAAKAALAARDIAAIEYIMHYGQGPELAPMLRAAASTLSESDQALVLLAAMGSAPAENAALAIALLAPGLHGVPQITDSLFDALQDAALGAAAALALAKDSDPAVRVRLNHLAEDEGTSATRARMALNLSLTEASQ